MIHDPLVRTWNELEEEIPAELPGSDGVDAVVLAVAHREYRQLDFAGWLGSQRPLILDANRVLTAVQREAIQTAGCALRSIGRGQ